MDTPPPYEAIDSFIMQGRWDLAEEAIHRSLVRSPENAWLLGNLALCEANQGRAEQGQATLLRALAIDADMAWGYYLLGKLILTTGRARKAEGSRPWWRWLLPETASERALADAEDAYRTALSLDPHMVDAFAALSELKRLSGDLTAAEGFAAKGLAIDPANLDCLLELAQAHRFRGRHDEAEKLEREVLRISPNAAASFLSLGRSQLSTGHLAGAERALGTALRLDPESRGARSLLRDVQARLAFSPYAVLAGVVDRCKNPRYHKPLAIAGTVTAFLVVTALYLVMRFIVRPRFGETWGDASPIRMLAILTVLTVSVWSVFLMFRLAGEIAATLRPRSSIPRPAEHRFVAICGLVAFVGVAVTAVLGLVTSVELAVNVALPGLPLLSLVMTRLFVPFGQWTGRMWWAAASVVASSAGAAPLVVFDWWTPAMVVLGVAYVAAVWLATLVRDDVAGGAG